MNLGGQAALSTLSSFGRRKPPFNALSESLGKIPSRGSQVRNFFWDSGLQLVCRERLKWRNPTKSKENKETLEPELGSWVSQARALLCLNITANSCSQGANCKSFIQDYGFHTVPERPRCEIEPIARSYVHRVEDSNYDGVHGRLAALQKMA